MFQSCPVFLFSPRLDGWIVTYKWWRTRASLGESRKGRNKLDVREKEREGRRGRWEGATSQLYPPRWSMKITYYEEVILVFLCPVFPHYVRTTTTNYYHTTTTTITTTFLTATGRPSMAEKWAGGGYAGRTALLLSTSHLAYCWSHLIIFFPSFLLIRRPSPFLLAQMPSLDLDSPRSPRPPAALTRRCFAPVGPFLSVLSVPLKLNWLTADWLTPFPFLFPFWWWWTLPLRLV